MRFTLAVAVNHDGSVFPLGNCRLPHRRNLTRRWGSRRSYVTGRPESELCWRYRLRLLASTPPEQGALQVFLRQLPARSRVHLITFSDGDRVHALPGFRASSASAAIDAMAMEGRDAPALAGAACWDERVRCRERRSSPPLPSDHVG